MKQTLLLGLTAFALFFFSSCSNILEDSGNPSAIAETGKLSLALEADASVSVTTKATTSISLEGVDLNAFQIEGTKDGAVGFSGTYAEFVGDKAKAVSAGTYSEITATYGTMDSPLAFDNPTFSGSITGPITVEANKLTTVVDPIIATLSNSIITVDGTAFSKLQGMATISELYVYAGTEENPKFDLFSNGNLVTDPLFVESGRSDVCIYIAGTLLDKTTKFSHRAQIKDNPKDEASTTSARKNYNVQYSFLETDGTLKLSISVNGEVDVVNIPVEVNPYE